MNLQDFAIHVANVPWAETCLGQTGPIKVVGTIDGSMLSNVTVDFFDDGIDELMLSSILSSDQFGEFVVDCMPNFALFVVALQFRLKNLHLIHVILFQRIVMLH